MQANAALPEAVSSSSPNSRNTAGVPTEAPQLVQAATSQSDTLLTAAGKAGTVTTHEVDGASKNIYDNLFDWAWNVSGYVRSSCPLLGRSSRIARAANFNFHAQ